MADYRLPDELVEALKSKFPGIEVGERQDVTVPPDGLIPFMTELKENPDYAMDYLTNLTGADYPDRFEMIYNLVSMTHGYTLTVRVKIPDKDNPEVPSLCPLWGGADWQEREIYDLMGIVFTGCPGHPTRIFLEENFKGHPLRKDFRWEGGREP
ncbi:MAG: NADH-quinone oxidoreductase subunit C [Peptococcaceae bacterium]|nr:NADH-quinone oxidoreductase subunit C [Peptococcaceae bacterium]